MDRNDIALRRYWEAQQWWSSSEAAVDRNSSDDPVGSNEAFTWRSSSRAAVDRNVWSAWIYYGLWMWRSPSGATVDRNEVIEREVLHRD
ncbi:hypothetical protein ABT168_09725 [Streptomyces sp. NPDC001793]|uniref:hypothetical protein n=1 Tax=Streptomyces sp. NPDC001793 TaxID=3154657 RepID=UPI003316FB24